MEEGRERGVEGTEGGRRGEGGGGRREERRVSGWKEKGGEG